jgi:general secretion pathway protein G
VALVVAPANVANWHGPYLKKGVPPDPWGKAYVFKSPGDNGREYEISSLGGDGAQGGTDENADVVSWQ